MESYRESRIHANKVITRHRHSGRGGSELHTCQYRVIEPDYENPKHQKKILKGKGQRLACSICNSEFWVEVNAKITIKDDGWVEIRH